MGNEPPKDCSQTTIPSVTMNEVAGASHEEKSQGVLSDTLGAIDFTKDVNVRDVSAAACALLDINCQRPVKGNVSFSPPIPTHVVISKRDNKDASTIDTTATSSPHLQGVIRTRQLTSREILAFDVHPMEISHRYDMRGIAKNKDGADVARVTITGINHVPTARFNLFSATYAVTNGWTFFGDSTGVTLNKGSSSMKFDLLIPTGSGFLYAIRIVPESDLDVAAVAVEKVTVKKHNDKNHRQNNEQSDELKSDGISEEHNRMNTVTLPRLTRQLVHYRMCHVNQRDAEKVAKYFGYGLYKPRNINATALPLAQNVQHILMCEACQISRTKRHGVKKQSDHIPSTQTNGRVFVDISTIREAGGFPLTKGVCIGVVDEYSKFGVMFFVDSKGHLPIVLYEIFSKWRDLGRPVQIVRCDNAGENKAFEKMAMNIKWQLALTFEYTPARTPEMNHLIEKFFDTHFARLRAMLSYAHIPDHVKPLIVRSTKLRFNVCNAVILCSRPSMIGQLRGMITGVGNIQSTVVISVSLVNWELFTSKIQQRKSLTTEASDASFSATH